MHANHVATQSRSAPAYREDARLKAQHNHFIFFFYQKETNKTNQTKATKTAHKWGLATVLKYFMLVTQTMRQIKADIQQVQR